MARRRNRPCLYALRYHADYSFAAATGFRRRQATERRGLRMDYRIFKARAKSCCHPRKRTYVRHLVRDQPVHWPWPPPVHTHADCIVVGVLRNSTISQDSKRTSSVALWSKVFPKSHARMQAIEDRALKLLRIPNTNRAEGLQVVSYGAGQRYNHLQFDRTAHHHFMLCKHSF